MIELSQVAAPFRVRYIKLSQAKACAYRKKRKESMARFNSVRENFEKKEKKVKVDLDEASKIWAELSTEFKWWQSLP